MRKNKRPLLWADSDNSGIIIDPYVNAIADCKITQSDVDKFMAQWDAKPDFKTFAQTQPAYMQFEFQSYPKKFICDTIEKDAKNMVMG